MSANMTKGPLVSIITPTFNRAKMVVEAIESVLQQTYQSWEMIIWDDGSTDETPQILQKCDDPRIRCYRGMNGGQAFAMNQALARAKGEYIALLDDDDKWLPSKLAQQVEILERFREADILFANFENLDMLTGRTTVSFEANRDVLDQLKTRLLEASVNLIVEGFLESLLDRNFILPSTTMMRKAVCDSVGKFNEELKGPQDLDYWWRCGLRGVRFAYLEEALVHRRTGGGNFSQSGARGRLELIKTLGCCLGEARKAGREDMVRIVRRATGTAWENMIRFYLGQGQKRKALEAFQRRCRYGLSVRAVALAVCSLCGPGTLRLFGSAPNASATGPRVSHGTAENAPAPAGEQQKMSGAGSGKREES